MVGLLIEVLILIAVVFEAYISYVTYKNTFGRKKVKKKNSTKWLSIIWKGVMSVINAKGKIRAERKRKVARRMLGE